MRHRGDQGGRARESFQVEGRPEIGFVCLFVCLLIMWVGESRGGMNGQRAESFYNLHLRIRLLDFRERGRERERNINWLPPIRAPSGN